MTEYYIRIGNKIIDIEDVKDKELIRFVDNMSEERKKRWLIALIQFIKKMKEDTNETTL